MKKLISLLVLLAMAVSLTVPAAAAEDASASTMRLESTEGTVTVKNASGLDVKLQSKLRLYDGYTVKTNSASYAYISLDGAKTLKLDASSEASVSKSGKKLEITLVSGSLFFNVSKPLESSESLNIRTSTMVTGVRGTSACVSAPSRNHSEITLLTGRLEVTGRDTHSGEMETVEMVAGDQVIVSQEAAGTPREHLDIQKLSAKEPELPGFAAVEIAKDPELQNKIAAETELSVPLIIADAAERLAADEAAAREKEAEVRQELEQERREQPQGVDPVFRTDDDDDIYGRDDDDDGGSGSNGGSSGSQPTVPGKTVTLTDPTQEELQAALNSDGIAMINLLVTAADPTAPTADPVLKLAEDLTIPQGKALDLLSGTLCNEAHLTVSGTLTVASGTCLTNTGLLDGNSGSVIYVYGSLVNITDNTSGTLEDYGIFTSGTINVSSGGEIVNAGSVNSSFIVVYGRLDMNGGTVSNSGNFEISGYDEVHATAYLTGSQFNNNGALTIGGTMTVGSGATLNNGANGDVSVYSTNSLHIAGTMTNAGRLWIGGLVDDAVASGRVAVSGTLELQGDTGNGRVVIAGSGSVLEISGTLKVSGSPDITVHPESSFLIRENASYQLFKLEPGPTETLQTPVEGYYTYANPSAPSAGGASDYVVFKLEPTGAVPEPGTHTVSFVKVTGLKGVTSSDGTPTETADSWDFTVPDGSIFTFQLIMEPGYEHSAYTTGGDASSDVRVQEDSATGIWTIAKRTNGAEGIIGDLTLKFVVTQATAPVDPVDPEDPASSYTVTFQGANFSIEHNGSTIPAGGSAYATPGEAFTFTVTPAANYGIASVSDGADLVADATTGEYSLGVISADVTVTVETKSSTLDLDLTVSNLDDLIAALKDPVLETINVSNAALTVTAPQGSVLHIPGEKTLNLRSGTLSFEQEVSIDGALTTDAGTTLTLSYNSANSNYGHTTVNSGGTLKIGGHLEIDQANLTNEGTLELPGSAKVNAGYVLTNGRGGSMTVSKTGDSSELLVDGQSGVYGTLSNSGDLTVESGGKVTVTSNGKLSASAPGTLSVESGGIVTVADGSNLSIYFGGTVSSSGTLTVGSGPLSVTNGTLEITGGAAGTDSYDSSVILSIGAEGKVNLSGGTLRVASITGPSGTDHGIFQWSGAGTIECMNDTTNSSPVDSSGSVTLTHSGTSTIETPTSISGQTGWYAWTLADTANPSAP